MGDEEPGLTAMRNDPSSLSTRSAGTARMQRQAIHAAWSGEERAIVCANGNVEEAVDGAGMRRLRRNMRIVAYARALLATAGEQARFVWVDDEGAWLSVRIEAQAGPDDLVRAHVTLAEIDPPFDLTLRELDVLTLMAAGLANQQIAALLDASPRTITKHVENILTKMQLGSRAGAAGVAVDNGLLRMPTPGLRPLKSLSIGALEAAASGTAASGGAVSGNERARPRSRSLPAKRPIIVGSPRMSTGLGRFDSDEMYRGASLAIAEINAAGGVGGRKIELMAVDCDVTNDASLIAAYKTFLDAEVDAVATGYSSAEAMLHDMMADYGCPYLHATTSEALVSRVRNDPTRYANIFQVCPCDIHYGPELARFIDGLEERGEWQPRNRRVLAVTTGWMDLNFGNFGITEMGLLLESRGWQLEVMDNFSPGNTDWSETMNAIHRSDPAVIFVGFAFPTASMSFQRAFLAAPTQSLIYTMYSPSIPVFRSELGELADGVLWSTTTGLYSDAIGASFAKRYSDQYGIAPGRSHAGIAYDRIRLLANSWSRTGNSRAFARVNEDLRTFVHRGVNGSYFLGNEGQSTLAYENHTPDPSISQAHLVFQIQKGRQRILSPRPYVDGRFELPWWFDERHG